MVMHLKKKKKELKYVTISKLISEINLRGERETNRLE